MIHLSPESNRQVVEARDRALAGEPLTAKDRTALQTLRGQLVARPSPMRGRRVLVPGTAEAVRRKAMPR
jgi:hypothetical protein